MTRPLLLLDVDGVLNPYPDTPVGYTEYTFFPDDDEPVRLNATHATWLKELGSAFDIVWASAWGEAANEFICATFQLPAFAVLPLPNTPFDPAEKLPAVAAFVADRTVAWVDDAIPDAAFEWAAARSAPTLLVRVDPTTGLRLEDVDALKEWSRSTTRQSR